MVFVVVLVTVVEILVVEEAVIVLAGVLVLLLYVRHTCMLLKFERIGTRKE